jgi:hypothetical protein
MLFYHVSYLTSVVVRPTYPASEFNGHLSLFLTPSIPNYYLF